MKFKVFGLIILLLTWLGCASGSGGKQAKIYQDNLLTMTGKGVNEIHTQIQTWDFDLLDSWQAENPDSETIKKHKRPVGGFSKIEIQEIFTDEGTYQVRLYLKKLGSSSATIGDIASNGMSNNPDVGVSSARFSVIRIVCRDNRLVNSRVWGSVSSSSLSGLRTKR